MNDEKTCDECGREFSIYAYGDETCPGCGREYIYEEGHMPVLSEVDWESIRVGKPKDG